MLYQELPMNFQVRFASCGNCICEEGGMIHPKRVLDTFVLLVGVSGEIAIAQENTVYTLIPDTALLLFPGMEHRGVLPSSAGLSYYWCHFTLQNCTPVHPKAKTMVSDVSRQIPEFCVFQNSARVKFLCRYLLDASRAEACLRAEVCAHVLSLLLLEIAGEASASPGSIGRKGIAEVRKILEWVRLYLPEISSVEDVAAHFCYNKEYLTTLVRRVTGKPLIAHLISLRIEEAQSLLLCSDKRISEIAQSVGFEDEKYFSRVFRKNTGLTPTQYRYANLRVHCNRK